MKPMTLFFTVLFALTLLSTAHAGTSEVTWQNPDKYRDIDAGESHRSKFKLRLFKEFEQHFALLAAKLPEGQMLKITVTDVDLAGDVNQTMRRIRVIKDIFFPRIELSYQLLDANGKVLKQGSDNIKDMGFMMHSSVRYNHDFINYEKEMLDDWFKATFM